jgi:hypothetical protein
MAEIEMIPTPGSEQIAAAGYDKESKTLRVEFVKNGGATYEYDDVPDGVLEQMLHAPSVGGYFHSQVRTSYGYRRIS